jgi:hypothetical protein
MPTSSRSLELNYLDSYAEFPFANFPLIEFATAIAPSHYAFNGVVRAGLASSVLLQLPVILSCRFTSLWRWTVI